MFPRRSDCSVVKGKDVTPAKVRRLIEAAQHCWDAIMEKDLENFAAAYRDSFEAQTAMFPAMMQPGVEDFIDKIKGCALAWKMTGAGGGGYLLIVVPDGFKPNGDFLPIRIRRRD